MNFAGVEQVRQPDGEEQLEPALGQHQIHQFDRLRHFDEMKQVGIPLKAYMEEVWDENCKTFCHN